MNYLCFTEGHSSEDDKLPDLPHSEENNYDAIVDGNYVSDFTMSF